MNFAKSKELQGRFHAAIPGGAHTYAKGDDQFPESMPVFIQRGKGCRVWDVDGNEFIEYGMGLRSVTLGHAFEPVIQAVREQLERGGNFVRPCRIELDCAERLQSLIPCAEMVKFAKDGSDVTTGAVKLARAYTGRDMVGICADHPFFSVDDWFIGTTPLAAGIPKPIRDLTVTFRYNDLTSVRKMFAENPGRIACVMLEVEREVVPAEGFLASLKAICRQEGAVLVFDEMITGFRWDNGGAQRLHSVTPDLATFGKGIANGFSVAALTGKREIMRLGGLDHDRERVFLLSTTHGAEAHGLSAALETMRIYKEEPVVEALWRQGRRLSEGVLKAAGDLGLQEHFTLSGRPCCLLYATRDRERKPSQAFRTLFLQETMKRGLLAPSLVISYSHTNEDIDRTINIISEALQVYRRALEEGVETYLEGRPVKPVFRQFN